MLTTIIPGKFKHIPELSVYDHNVYSDGKRFIKENFDECCNCYIYEEVVDNLGNSLEYLGMTENNEDQSIFDLNEKVILNSNYY